MVGDAEYGEPSAFRRAVDRLRLPYALGIRKTATVFVGAPHVMEGPPSPPRGRPRKRPRLAPGERPVAVGTLAQELPATVSSTRSHTIDLDWSDSCEPDVSHYKVYVSNTGGGPYDFVSTTSTSDYHHTGVVVDETYVYVVTAVDNAGNESARRDEATVLPATVDPTFKQVKKLTASDAAAEDEFGHAIATSGDTAVVGANKDDDACPERGLCWSGSAYVCQLSASP